MVSRRNDDVRKTLVQPLGLVTTPNPYGQYPEGGMEVADNVSLRAPGELRTLPSVGTTSNVYSSNADATIHKMMPLNAGHVYAFSLNSAATVWQVDEGVISGSMTAATLPAFAPSLLFTPGRICPVRPRESLLVNSTGGVMVGDSMAPSNSGERALRWAGLPQPSVVLLSSSGASGPIPSDIALGYVVIFRRVATDGYILQSVPSSELTVLSTGGVGVFLSVSVQVSWNSFAGMLAGDYVDVFRTDGLNTTSANADPGTTVKLIASYALTATDILNGNVTIKDLQPVVGPFYTTTGREAYTNPGQEGANGANDQPDICGAMEVFKDFTFYGNITERPQLIISSQTGFGFFAHGGDAFLRQYGIGQRQGNGTITNGSPTITAVSATDLLGIVPGQLWCGGSNFTFGSSKVLSVGATTITMSTNAVGAGATFALCDVLEIDGGSYTIFGFASLIYGLPGLYEVTASISVSTQTNLSPGGATVVISPNRSAFQSTITARATNGANYSPTLPEINQTVATFSRKTTKNLMRWSKKSEPEAVPSANEDFVGSAIIIAFKATKDALWIACTDGISRLSGSDGVWRIDIIAPRCILAAPQCINAVAERIFAQTNYGFVEISDAGVEKISLTRINELLPGSPFAEQYDLIVEGDQTNNEVIISTGKASQFFYIYNILQNAFTRFNVPATPAFNNWTAFAFMANPASGAGFMLLGSSASGNAAQIQPWNSTSTWLPPVVLFQRCYDKNVMLSKQWLDATYLFDVGDINKTIGAKFNSTTTQGVGTLKQANNDGESWATIGVPKKAAVSQSLRPGWSMAFQSTQSKFRGVSLRYVPLTIQQQRRG
jgi:hypothetical protein